VRIADRLVGRLLKWDLQTRLVVGFLIATCITGFVATWVGIWTINKIMLAEIQNRVRQDINTARLIYDYHLDNIRYLLIMSAEEAVLADAIQKKDLRKMEHLQNLVRRVPICQKVGHFVNMLSVVDAGGNVLYRATNPGVRGDNVLWDPVIRKCIQTKAPQVSTELMSNERIIEENPSLRERVSIEIVETPKSFEHKEKQLSEGMVMRAAYPILGPGEKLIGVLVGGFLLNKDRSIVDKVKETIYRDEKYKGREMGVATIFQGGVRISTNVMTTDNKRAIGTTLSKEVYRQVIQEGRDWVGRAFVVNDWYITTYTPIHNSENKVIGILYTGLLEEKYRDIKWRTIAISLGIITLGMIIAFIISFRLGSTIIRRIRLLKKATEAVAAGNLDYKLSPDRISGFDMLDEAFNDMSRSLKDRDERLQKVHEQLARSEKLTALGEMAAGVAHEINNPLGGILLYSDLVLEDIPENSPARENMQKIIYQTNRCKDIVQNLLDFSRAPTGEMVPLQINHAIRISLGLVKDQAMFQGIEIETRLADNLPEVIGDQSLLEQVFLNLFINAADAMKERRGKLTVVTLFSKPQTDLRCVEDQEGRRLTLATLISDEPIVKVIISDTGKGIAKEYLPHIFEPFFTTKESGQGTGLGLSIVYGVIRKHNGLIEAESVPDEGTTFTITLPSNQTGRLEKDGLIGGGSGNRTEEGTIL
jgi:two-component system, NtrC family, sensor kinase